MQGPDRHDVGFGEKEICLTFQEKSSARGQVSIFAIFYISKAYVMAYKRQKILSEIATPAFYKFNLQHCVKYNGSQNGVSTAFVFFNRKWSPKLHLNVRHVVVA